MQSPHGAANASRLYLLPRNEDLRGFMIAFMQGCLIMIGFPDNSGRSSASFLKLAVSFGLGLSDACPKPQTERDATTLRGQASDKPPGRKPR